MLSMACFREISKNMSRNRFSLKSRITIPGTFSVRHFRMVTKNKGQNLLPIEPRIYVPKFSPIGLRYNTDFIDQVAIEEAKPKIPMKVRLRNWFIKHKRRGWSYLLIGTTIIVIAGVVGYAWTIIGGASSLTVDPNGAVVVQIQNVDENAVAYGAGVLTAIAVMGVGYVGSRFFSHRPEKAYRQLKRDILSNPLVRCQMGSNIRVGGYHAYSLEDGGFTVFTGANKHDEGWKKYFKMKRVNMIFQIQSAGVISNISNSTVPNAIGLVSASFHSNLSQDVWYDYVALDVLNTGSRMILWGDRSEDYNIIYNGYVLTNENEMRATEQEDKEEKENEQNKKDTQPDLLVEKFVPGRPMKFNTQDPI